MRSTAPCTHHLFLFLYIGSCRVRKKQNDVGGGSGLLALCHVIDTTGATNEMLHGLEKL